VNAIPAVAGAALAVPTAIERTRWSSNPHRVGASLNSMVIGAPLAAPTLAPIARRETMMRCGYALMAALAVACGKVESPPRAELEAAMRKAADGWIAANPAPGGAGWNLGVHYWGLSALQAETGDRRYFDRVHAWGEANGWQPYGGGLTNNADNTVCAMAYWNQHEAGDSAATIINVEPSIMSQRNAVYPWIDLFFMGFPLSARYGRASADASFFDGVHRIFAADRDALYSTADSLWWRDAQWANGRVFWSRGNGWVFAGMAAAFEFMPPRDDMLAVLRAMSAKLRTLQKPSGLWSSALLPAAGYDASGPETSGTALFLFGIAKLVRLGFLDRAQFLPVANAAWNGIRATALQPDGVLGYCQPGDNKPMERPLTPADTADFCVGAFLLAGTELARLR
jgi:rhamnogalacturonyl hydrolase YesR